MFDNKKEISTLCKISIWAEDLSKLANNASQMEIYCTDPSWHRDLVKSNILASYKRLQEELRAMYGCELESSKSTTVEPVGSAGVDSVRQI